MRPRDLVLRCFAQKESDGTWFAICLDLNLYARGDNFDEVKAKLRGFIRHYVKSALTTDRDYIGDLVPRRAPFAFWAKYFCMCTLAWCGNQIAKLMYRETLPLKLA